MVMSSYKDIGLYYKNFTSHNLKVNILANKRFLMFMPLVKYHDPFINHKHITTLTTFKHMVSACLSNSLFEVF